MVLTPIQQHVLSRLAQAPGECVIKVCRNDDWSIRCCHFDYSANPVEPDTFVSQVTFDVLRKERYITPGRIFGNMQCWTITEAGKLALDGAE